MTLPSLPPTLRPPRAALTSLALVSLLSSLGTSIAHVALPALAAAFHAPFVQVQWVVVAYLLALTTVIVSAGRLGDLTGPRRLLLAGVALFTLSAAIGAVPRLPVVIGARALQGVGAAVMMALSLAAAHALVATERAGRIVGLLGTVSALGTALGPAVGGALLALGGWQALFLAQVPLGLLAWGLLWLHLPPDLPRAQLATPFDWGGSLLLAATLAVYALAMTARAEAPAAPRLMLLACAVATGTGLVLHLGRSPHPLLKLALLRDPLLASGLVTSAAVASVMMATLVAGPFYLSGALRLEAAPLGAVMALGPLVAALCAWPAGRCVDRLGAPRMALAGLAGMAGGCAALALQAPTGGALGYALSLAGLTGGYAFFQTSNNTQVLRTAGPAQRGLASGLLNLARHLGLITGATLMGSAFAGAAGGRDPAHASAFALRHALAYTFSLAILVLGLAVLATVWGLRYGRRA